MGDVTKLPKWAQDLIEDKIRQGDALRDDSQDADDPTGVVHLVEADPLSRAKERVLKAAKKWQAWQQPDVPAPRGTLFTDLEEEMKRAVEALRKAEGKK